MSMRYCMATDRGIRPVNEDTAGIWSFPVKGYLFYLFAVADGLGGHAAGEVASAVAISELSSCIGATLGSDRTYDHHNAAWLLGEGFSAANHAVLVQGSQSPGCDGMGTTLVAVLCDEEGRGAICHIGDSRAYRVGREIQQLTRDHSYVQELVESGVITPDQAMDHPYRNIVTRIIGRPGEQPDIIPLAIGDERILLCSDGLFDGMPDTEIHSLLTGNALEEACSLLINRAKETSRDNITVIVIEKGRESSPGPNDQDLFAAP